MSQQADWTTMKRLGKSREFIAESPLRSTEIAGQKGVLVRVRLTSYRSLPLSCVESIGLSVDGKVIETHRLRLLINQHIISLSELPKLSDVWWFILDYADLFVPLASPLGPGLHEIQGTLVTVEPYMTAGRFSFHHDSRRHLSLESVS